MTYIAPRSKLFEHMPRLAMLKRGDVPAPVNCELDLSNRCSLGCEWCHFAFTHTRGPLAGKREKPPGATPGGDLMDRDLALSIVDQLAAAGVASLTLTGGGEPTLHPNFDEIVEYAAGKIKLGLYTHGGHISPERAALLKRSMTFVYVSLDAADAVSYKRDKGVDRFAAACEGIRLLVEAEGDATIGVGYLVTERNWVWAGVAAELAVETLGADYIQFRPTIAYDQVDPDTLIEETAWMPEALNYLEVIARSINGVEIDAERFRMYQEWDGHPYPTCWWSALQTVITPNGKVWTCVNKREHADAEIGDLSRETFAEVWGRRTVAQVDGSCRVMCRGHLANLALDGIMDEHPHPEFV